MTQGEQVPPEGPGNQDVTAGEPTAAVAQTDAGFSFQGIPPIEEAAAGAAPSAGAAGPAVAEATPVSGPEATAAGDPTAAVAQTDPGFSFQGIPPIEDGENG